MLTPIFFFLVQSISSNEFPSIKYPKKGIFGWFNSLSHMKKPFNNKKILGFTANTSKPDLHIFAIDIANHLNLHDLNISAKIAEAVNKNNQKKRNSLLSQKSCPDKDQYENVYQLCHLTGINLDLQNIGIPLDHTNILIGNVAGYFPTGLFLIILAIVTIVIYIFQLSLCCFICKPSEHTSPYIWSIILFYAGDALVLISAILYFCSFTGINSLFSTLISLNTVVPRITYSIASSLQSITTTGIPNGVGPLIEKIISICNSTKNYLDITAESFLSPTIILQKKMVSKNESDLGVFVIYNDKIQPLANDFYTSAKKYPKLSNISSYFARQNFTSYQDQMQDLLSSELDFADQMKELNSFFEYLNSTLEPYQKYITHLPEQELKGTNKTIKESIEELKQKSLESFDSLTRLNKSAKNKHTLYIFICIVFFIFGIVLLGAPIFLGIMYCKHTKCSICIASTVGIYPIVATILMFAVSVVFTGIGFADVELSDQLEPSIDQFLTRVIARTIPTFDINIPPINVSEKTDDQYNGVIRLDKIVFSNPMTTIENFVNSNEETGIADSLKLQSIANMDNYGDELGNFIIRMGQNFTLPKNVVYLLNSVENLFHLVSKFPDTIDGFFNWGIQMTKTTNKLRQEINNQDPSASPELEPYLKEIDRYVELMNSQYKIAKYQISDRLTEALSKLEERLLNYIRSITNDLGSALKHLFKNVYPFLNTIQIGPIIGPYAILRNFFFYDVASTSAYLSASGTLMMFGLAFVVILMWIRRKGMCPDNYPVNKNKSSTLNLNALDEDNFGIANTNPHDVNNISNNPSKNVGDVVYKSFV